MADSDSEDSIDQYFKDLVNNPVDADDSGSDISMSSINTVKLTDFDANSDN